ncbi:MAG TPA: type II toxin-antitoxin system VapC family toxin [Dehalococcoidia bacterium]|nr:type II toxin-antitoxin system VapC family toxin [Dehalococcoidia bacterium]
MSLLLDTHALLWWLADSPELSHEARTAIADEDEDVFVSIATAWEISIKRSLGRMETPDDLGEQLERHRFDLLPITLSHVSLTGRLPLLHRDPFDRMLIAQAMTNGLTLVTRDRNIARYDVSVLPA